MRLGLRPAAATVDAVLGPPGNSIGFLRYALAALVVFHHAWVLNGRGALLDHLTKGALDLGVIAVSGFFVLSGFLIARSAERTSTPRFFWHRVLRIMPAFWVCLVVCAVVFGPLYWIADHGSLDGYGAAGDRTPVGYVVNNLGLLMRQVTIDGVLANAPYRAGINGSLWTLAYEFAWYAIAGGLGLLGILGHRRAALAVLAVLVVPSLLAIATPLVGVPILGYGLASRFAGAFSLGIVAYLWRRSIPLDDRLAVVAAVAFGASLVTGTYPTIGVAALAYGLMWAAWRIPLRRFDARWDLSYGLYIYAFPVQQLLAVHGSAALHPLASFAAVLAIASGLAWLSYVLVERPALRLKSWSPPSARKRAEPIPALAADG